MSDIILKRLLAGVVPDRYTPIEKVLAFYRLVIDLERSKEPDIRDYYEYPVNFKNDKLILIDFPCNATFLKVFEKNRNPRETKFPNDLYVGITIVTGGVAYRLLNIVIGFEDIKAIDIDNELLPVKIANFEVNLKEASRLELLPEKIESINEGIKANPTWTGILSLLRQEIAEDVTIPKTIFLALSTKSIELAQIYSELNNFKLQNALDSSPLLNSFLLNSPIDNIVDNKTPDEIIRITELDQCQLEAVTAAMNSKVSVITGPPGTGKTQVIENILANALLSGKKVLVASKNNKAVDNVKERFDKIDPTGYFLRFGSKRHITTSTKPEIAKLLTEIPKLKDNSIEFDKVRSLYKQHVENLRSAKEALERRNILASELPSLQHDIKNEENRIQQEKDLFETNVSNVKNQYADIEAIREIDEKELGGYLSKLNILRNTIKAKFTGLFGFWYKVFSKKKYAMILLNHVQSFPYQWRNYLQDQNIKSDVSDFNTPDDLINFCNEIILVFGKISKYKKAIDLQKDIYQRKSYTYQLNLVKLNNSYSKKKEEFDNLCSQETAFHKAIKDSQEWIKENSNRILAVHIHHQKLSDNAIQNTQAYVNYIPESIPYTPMEYSVFIQKTERFLNIFKLCSVTSLSTKNSFPLTSELFDMLIIDEASQCDVASAIPLIMRAKQLVVIGDPMQLRHITSVKLEEEQDIKKHLGLDGKAYIQYADKSLWDYCSTFISQSINGLTSPLMLDGHYRCYPDIINYSNEQFYERSLGHSLEVRTNMSKLKGQYKGIYVVDVKGKQVSDSVNINVQEAQKSINMAIQIAQQDKDVSIGIITPFRHQAEKINSMIPDNLSDRIEANTVHKYQGDEKDIIIYSLVVTSNSPDKKIYWVDNIVPNLVNVAVTRARSALFVVCDKDYILSHSSDRQPLGHLVRKSS